jgi:predicted PurR-regulated permease PerM
MRYKDPLIRVFSRPTLWIPPVLILSFLFIFSYRFPQLVVYLVLGFLFTLPAESIYTSLGRIRIKGRFAGRSIRALASVLVIWAVVLMVFWLLLPIISSQVKQLSKVNTEMILVEIDKPINLMLKGLYKETGLLIISEEEMPMSNEAYLKVKSMPGGEALDSVGMGEVFYEITVKEIVKQRVSVYLENLRPMRLITPMLNLFSHALIGFFAVSFIAFFLLRDRSYFSGLILPVFPPAIRAPLREILSSTRRLLLRYFGGVALQVGLITLLISIGLLVSGLPFTLAITIGFFVGLFNIVPYVGPLIGGAFGLTMVISAHIDAPFTAITVPLLVKTCIVFIVVQIIDNLILQVYLFGKSIQAHPLEIFLVIFMGGSLAGIPGMILAVPAYTLVRLVAIQGFRLLQTFYAEYSDEFKDG